MVVTKLNKKLSIFFNIKYSFLILKVVATDVNDEDHFPGCCALCFCRLCYVCKLEMRRELSVYAWRNSKRWRHSLLVFTVPRMGPEMLPMHRRC